MPTKPNPDLVAERAANDMHNDAIHVAAALEGEIGAMGAKELAKGAFLELAARDWNDRRPIWGVPPNLRPFREFLLLAMGPSNFMKLYEEGAQRGMLHPDSVQPPMAGLGGAVAPSLPPTLAVQPTPPSLPAPLVGAMTNANG